MALLHGSLPDRRDRRAGHDRAGTGRRRVSATTGRDRPAEPRLAAGDHLTLDGIQLDALWPLPGTVPLRPPDSGTAINNVSIVLDVHFGARRIVLAGDVEEQIDPQLLAEGIAADGATAWTC